MIEESNCRIIDSFSFSIIINYMLFTFNVDFIIQSLNIFQFLFETRAFEQISKSFD